MNISNPNESEFNASYIMDCINIRITRDDMEVYISLEPLMNSQVYTKEHILKKLRQYKVVWGINETTIQLMLERKIYYKEILVAQGDRVQNGSDGIYRYSFHTYRDDKPIILEDGSVDYSSLSKLETVKAGDVIAEYTPATKGVNGKSVKGHTIFSKNGRELMSLKGKGFTLSEDHRRYIADIDGKVEFVNGEIEVSDILIVKTDIDAISGNAYFHGNIVIQGNVLTGVKVEATGNITVEGHVEAATLISGGDVILKNGMQGGGKGAVIAKGNVLGKFFEQVAIQAEGNIYANTIVHCNIQSNEEVIVSGKRGTIVGGVVSAARAVTATVIGSMAEVATEIKVGIQSSIMPDMLKKEESISKYGNEIKRIEEALRLIDIRLEKEESKQLQLKKMLLLRSKAEKNSQVNSLMEERDRLIERMEKTSNAKVVVSKFIYPRVRIRINGSILVVKQEHKNVIIERKGLDVCLFANE